MISRRDFLSLGAFTRTVRGTNNYQVTAPPLVPVDPVFMRAPTVIGGPIVLRPQSLLETFIIEDVIIDGEGDYAIDIRYPHAPSHLLPTVILNRVVVRCQGEGWRRGLYYFENCWNGRAIDCWGTGVINGQTIAQPITPVGIDCGNSMDFHVIRPNITSCAVGVRVCDTNESGEGEGFHCESGWLMHNYVSVHLKGYGSGGWPTPAAWVKNMHMCHIHQGVLAERYSGVHVESNDIYASHVSQFAWGAYFIDCTDVIYSNNRHWSNHGHPNDGAFVGVRSHITASGNRVNPSIATAGVLLEGSILNDFGNDWGGRQIHRG